MSPDKKTLIDNIIDRVTYNVKASWGYEPDHEVRPHATAFPFDELELWQAHRVEHLIAMKRIMDVPMSQLQNMMLGIYDNHQALEYWSKQCRRSDDSYEAALAILNESSLSRLEKMLASL